MSKYSLLLSLGHNSSAIALKDGQVLGGYETERFTKIKSDSSFPYGPIRELVGRYKLPSNTDIYISHWFIDSKLPDSNKYYDPEFLRQQFSNATINSVNIDFTHHDAHAWSSVAYMGKKLHNDATLLVADGFGNFGECISIYQCEDGVPRLHRRIFGFDKSLGMFYQYATAYMGMKMHNHEYKILGYETHINEIFDKDEIEKLNDYIKKYNPFKISHLLSLSDEGDSFDPVISLSALINTQAKTNDILDKMLAHLDFADSPEFEKRVIVSYFVQAITQNTILNLVSKLNPSQLVCSGGLFYNVKINYALSEIIECEFMPLAGDQGAAIGLYHFLNRDFVWPNHLFWGSRSFYRHEFEGIPNIICSNNDEEILNHLISNISRYGFVNLVRGAMEFGPRSLCNTATLALPTNEMVSIINELNDRTNVMPMAPVVTESKFRDLFELTHCTKSYDYMIVAAKYKYIRPRFHGAAHYYPLNDIYTGRPQITHDKLIEKLLEYFDGILINTSFNVHGVPIVFDAPQVIHSHMTQYRKDIANVITIVKTED